jgi:hypothetical protein
VISEQGRRREGDQGLGEEGAGKKIERPTSNIERRTWKREGRIDECRLLIFEWKRGR